MLAAHPGQPGSQVIQPEQLAPGPEQPDHTPALPSPNCDVSPCDPGSRQRWLRAVMAGSITQAAGVLGIDWEEWGRYGLRWADEHYHPGDALPPSRDWCPYCQEPLGSRPPDERWCPDCSWAEETVLGGTCAVEVTQETLCARLAASHYAGEHIYLIAADYGSYGEDPHEVVLGSADHPAVAVMCLDDYRLPV